MRNAVEIKMNLPILQNSQISSLFSEYTLAEAHIAVILGDSKLILSGFGCSIDGDKASASAYGEVNERIWSSIQLQRALGNDNVNISNFTGEFVTSSTIESILGLQNSRTWSVTSDATGYAYHDTETTSVQHGALEVIERHINQEIWIGHQPTLYTLENYSASINFINVIHPHVPYCMSICIGPDFLSIGAKCSMRLRDAIDGAKAEAIMIYQTYNDKSIIPPARHLATLNNLRQKKYREFTINTILKKSVPFKLENKDFIREFAIESIMSSIGLSSERFYFATFKSMKGSCVRVFSPDASHPQKYDASYQKLPML
jgi:hypothetical protein